MPERAESERGSPTAMAEADDRAGGTVDERAGIGAGTAEAVLSTAEDGLPRAATIEAVGKAEEEAPSVDAVSEAAAEADKHMRETRWAPPAACCPRPTTRGRCWRSEGWRC